MGLFDGVAGAKVQRGGNYEREGHYIQLIHAVKEGENREKRKFVAIEKTILKVLDDADGTGHHKGEDVGHLMWVNDSFLGNFKAFVMAVTGASEEEVTAEACAEITSEEQPLEGIVVEVKSVKIRTRAGKDFTKITYVQTLDDDEIAELIDAETIQHYGLLAD